LPFSKFNECRAQIGPLTAPGQLHDFDAGADERASLG
jgi:hypothetical protein